MLIFFHVLGSRSDLTTVKKQLQLENLQAYFQIQLGFIKGVKGDRWLTHEEISSGVINAIQERSDPFTIGVMKRR
ncbi:hypothetical protein [Alteribacter populi]|uniref:hypothetical protein n=1 Tax=Alteribacter populi TaxID=2011011 RepID=UPI000BBADC97|nr:hypothetical protein [Alteribacter populi]